MNDTGYKRFPAVCGDKVVFVSEDDLWEVNLSGGVARRLTSNSGEVSNPYISPDGKFIAFSGKEEGENDVYIIPSEGGANKRLTFIGGLTKVKGWTPDSRSVIFSSDTGQPLSGKNMLYSVSAEGGLPVKFPYGRGNNVSFGPRGGVLIGRNTMDPARWKRYKGGTAGVFWIDKKGNGKFEKFLSKIKGNLASPLWVGDRIFFISDHEGLGKLYSCDMEGKNIKSHSSNSEYYVRNSNTDGKNIVYHCGAEIFIYNIETEVEGMIDIKYYSPKIQRQRKFSDAVKYLESYNISPDGNSSTVTTRGKSFVFSNWDGSVLQVGMQYGVRYRYTQWMHDNKNIVTVSDENGSETIEIHSIKDGLKEVKKMDFFSAGIIANLKVSPKENKLAVSNNRYELYLIDTDNKNFKKIARSKFERIEDFCFSPDGKWIVYSLSDAEYLASLHLYSLDTGKSVQITPTGFRDYQPTFDPDGRFIYFLSQREYNPVYDTSYFQLGFSLGVRPYLITLKKETPSPFTPEYEKLFPEKRKSKKSKDGKSEIHAVNIDLDGIYERIISFPLPEKNYFQITAVKDGLLYSREPIKGSLHHWYWEQHPSDESLDLFNFTNQKNEHVAKNIKSFKVSMDGSTVIYRQDNNLYINSNILSDYSDHDSEKEPHHHRSRKNDWLDLSRIKVSIDPMREWKQMYTEAWRLQKEHFWTPDMSGINWDTIYKRYLPLLDKIASRSEFSDLIWEMQGELGTSHAYEIGGDYRLSPVYKIGKLGADFEFDEKENAYRIKHIIKGDSWKKNSPLKSPGTEINEGDYLISINGELLKKEVSPGELLVNQVKNVVSITIKNAVTGKLKNFEVRTIATDTEARYREWVEKNKEYVHKKSKGKLGYLHIPDMGPNGFSEFHRYYIHEAAKNGLVVDLRDNRGGHVSQLLLEKLSRKQYGYDLSRWGSVGTYPSHSVAGPIVALTDEHAGSDGDIFSHNFKQMKLGTLVGKRTWGGVIGIHPRLMLADGTMTTQPEYATYMKDVGWKVENYGTDPDVEVEMSPEDFAKGRDPQLDKAIEIALDQLKKKPVILPDFKNKPILSLPEIHLNGNGKAKSLSKSKKKVKQ
ncbi:MAG: PD40 domain-containing protein [Ignavibacteria bacterium]|nr:PD40 domain-containing protein [Ignavibacteria bacterium]